LQYRKSESLFTQGGIEQFGPTEAPVDRVPSSWTAALGEEKIQREGEHATGAGKWCESGGIRAVDGKKIGTVKSNEYEVDGRRIAIKCARIKTKSVGVPYQMLDRVAGVLGSFEMNNGTYEIYEMTPDIYRKHMRPTRSKGASADGYQYALLAILCSFLKLCKEPYNGDSIRFLAIIWFPNGLFIGNGDSLTHYRDVGTGRSSLCEWPIVTDICY
jgi:hypothetical protein